MNLSQMADRFEKLLKRLPGPLRAPVESEWRPLRDLFINRRPPRLLIAGPGAELFVRSALLSPGHLGDIGKGGNPPEAQAARIPDAALGEIEETGGPWRIFRHHGLLLFALACEEGKAARIAIAESAPDCFIFVEGPPPATVPADTVIPANTGAPSPDLRLLGELHRFDRERHGNFAPIVAVAAGNQTAALAEALYGEEALNLNHSVAAILPATPGDAVLAAIAKALPEEARLEFARVTGERAVQREIAGTLVRSTTAICTAIGTQPIPLADFPILTSLQVLMVAGIIHISGRQWSKATARDFLAALGVNVGAGLMLREGTRAAMKLFPGWGNAISGAVAGAGTYTLGHAAMAYFIEGLPLEETRRQFHLRSWRKKNKRLKHGELPPPPLPPAGS